MRYLAQGWDRIVRYPLLLMVPLVLQIALSALGLGAVNVILGWAAAGGAGAGGGLVMLGVFVVAFGGPAVASGYNAMAARAAANEEVSLSVMFANLGRYYGRIIGGVLLTALALGVLGAIAGLDTTWPMTALSIPIAALTHIWLAAVVIDDAGTFAAIGKACREAVRRIGDYGPLLVVAILAHFVVPALFGGGQTTDFTHPPTFLGNLGSLLSSLVTTAITMLVRAGTFVAYIEGGAAEGGDGKG